MNKNIIKVGLLIMILAIIFPPVKYVDSESRAAESALNDFFGGSSTSSHTEVTIRPIWDIDGEYPMTDEEVDTSYLLIEFLLIISFTFGIAYLTGENKTRK